MKYSIDILRSVLLIVAGLFALSAYADVIESNDDVTIAALPDDVSASFDLTDLIPVENPLSSIAYHPGSVEFEDGDGQALPGMDPSDPDWWHGEGLIYTTGTDTMIVDFTDLNVIGFTFRLGANMNARAWIRAHYSDDSAATGSLMTDWFGGIGPNTSPAYGVFVTDQSNCQKLDRVVIDPTFTWGLGEMQIATSDACTTQVPEPGSLGLLGAGLLAMGFAWRTRRRASIRR